MVKTSLGKILETNGGNFVLGTFYPKLTNVYDPITNASYRSKIDNQNVILTNTTTWQKIAQGVGTGTGASDNNYSDAAKAKVDALPTDAPTTPNGITLNTQKNIANGFVGIGSNGEIDNNDFISLKNRTSGTMINVKDFGAMGDGATDDTISIQNSIASLNGKGGTIFFPSGIYMTNKITLPTNTRILGESGFNYHQDVAINGATTLVPVTSTQTCVIDLSNSWNTTVEGVDIRNLNYDRISLDMSAVIISNSRWIAIIRCSIFDFRYGVKGALFSIAPQFLFCTIEENFYQGINIVASDGLMEGCYIAANTREGVIITGSSWRIASNKIEWNGGFGLDIIAFTYGLITGNVIDNNGKSGIIFDGSYGTNENIVVSNNSIVRNGKSSVKNTQQNVSIQFTINATNILITNNNFDKGRNDYNFFSTTLVAIANVGANSITVANSTGITANALIYLGNGNSLEENRVASNYVSGNIIPLVESIAILHDISTPVNQSPLTPAWNFWMGDSSVHDIYISNNLLVNSSDTANYWPEQGAIFTNNFGVTDIPNETFTINSKFVSIAKGQTFQFIVNQSASWTISSTLSTISGNGLLTVGTGETASIIYITASCAIDSTLNQLSIVAVY